MPLLSAFGPSAFRESVTVLMSSLKPGELGRRERVRQPTWARHSSPQLGTCLNTFELQALATACQTLVLLRPVAWHHNNLVFAS